jgi:hypothetical protein
MPTGARADKQAQRRPAVFSRAEQRRSFKACPAGAPPWDSNLFGLAERGRRRESSEG